MRLFDSILLLVLTLMCSATRAQETNLAWQLTDGAMYHLAFAPDDASTYYVGASGGIVLRSQDRGQTWTYSALRTHGSITSLMPMENGVVYATDAFDRSAIYRSTDDAETWTRLSFDAPNFTPNLTRISATAFLAGSTSTYFLISRDNGATLDTIQRKGHLLTAGDGKLVHIAGFGIFGNTIGAISRSDDLGRSWTLVAQSPVLTGRTRPTNNGLSFFMRDAQRFIVGLGTVEQTYVTSDGGATFTSVALPNRDIISLTWLSDTEALMFENSRIAYRTTDGGLSWTADPSANPANDFNFNNLAISSAPDGAQLASRGVELYTRPSDGATWTKTRQYLDKTRIHRIMPGDDKTVYVRFRNTGRPEFATAYKTSDAGVTWVPFANDSPQPILALSADTIISTAGPRLMRSTDGGVTHTEVANTGSAFSPFQLVIRFAEQQLLAFSGSQVYISTDRGLTWTVRSSGFNASFSSGIVEAKAWADGTIIVAPLSGSGGNAAQLSISRDTGRTFIMTTSIPRPYSSNRFDITADGKIFLAPSLMSVDTGRTWIELKDNPAFGPSNYSYVAFRNSQQGIFSDATRSVATPDGGATWTADGIPGFNVPLKEFAFLPDGSGFASHVGFYVVASGNWPVAELPINGSVGFAERRQIELMRLSPNPVTSGQQLRLGDASTSYQTLEIFNSMGQRVALLNVEGQAVTLPPGLAPGSYTLKAVGAPLVGRVLVR